MNQLAETLEAAQPPEMDRRAFLITRTSSRAAVISASISALESAA